MKIDPRYEIQISDVAKRLDASEELVLQWIISGAIPARKARLETSPTEFIYAIPIWFMERMQKYQKPQKKCKICGFSFVPYGHHELMCSMVCRKQAKLIRERAQWLKMRTTETPEQREKRLQKVREGHQRRRKNRVAKREKMRADETPEQREKRFQQIHECLQKRKGTAS